MDLTFLAVALLTGFDSGGSDNCDLFSRKRAGARYTYPLRARDNLV